MPVYQTPIFIRGPSVGEVSRLLGLRKARVYTLVREGVLPAVHIGRQIRIDKNALSEWIRAGGCALPGGWKRDGHPIPVGDQNER